MKILVVLPNFEGGGAERIHVNLANEWAKSGHEVIFCALEKKGPLIDLIGAQSRNRTGTAFLPRDFKSLVSTNFTTWAQCLCGL